MTKAERVSAYTKKECSACHEMKPLEDFPKATASRSPDGRAALCKPCNVKRSQKYRYIRIGDTLTIEQFLERIEIVERDGFEHWRYVPPKGGRARWESTARGFTSDRIRRKAPDTWCDDELDFKCLNPEHQTSVGTIEHASGEEVFGEFEDEAAQTFSLMGDYTEPDDERPWTTSRALAELESPARKELMEPESYDANAFLREHGYGVTGEPITKRKRAKRA